MTLAQLVADLPISAPPGLDLAAVQVTGVAHDSRQVTGGELFVVWRGEHHDGRVFAPEAVGRGAVAVLADGTPESSLDVPWLMTPRPRALLGRLGARLYRHPDRELCTVGVTGTNGKTTVAQLLAAVLDAHGLGCGVLGTLGYRYHDLELGGGRTSPEASELFRVLRGMRIAGAQAAVMEVSSHALVQGRVDGLGLDVGVFLNLSRDHLDFHPDMEGYFSAKRELFCLLKPRGTAVVNLDDEYGQRLAPTVSPVVTFGEGGDVELVEGELGVSGLRGRVRTPSGEIELRSRLVGRYNLSNLLAAIAVAEALGLPAESTIRALAEAGPVTGRMEPIDAGQSFPVFLDYAHTPAALEAALASLREVWGEKIAVVFGCGGDRDRGKRAEMGAVAARGANRLLITDDNPRTEEPAAIRRAVEIGVREVRKEGYDVVPGRRAAIRSALALAHREPARWAVLLAGKGHEEVQEVGDRVLPFSDRLEALAALGELLGTSEGR